jgi:2-polyprenyl-3-methyl-5-hydroxy-6-metoxy-1,4-benzoquinol methylase
MSVTFMNNKTQYICPLCHDSKANLLFSTKTSFQEFGVVQCRLCGLTRTYPLHSDESIYAHDSSDYYGKQANKFGFIFQMIRNKTMELRAKYYLTMLPVSVKRPKILDVGCAEGRLLNAFLKHGCECWGIEHPSYPARRLLNSDRITYLQDDFQAIDFDKGTFDIIILWHVLEHMDDPLLTMQKLCKWLTSNGVLIVAVPNFSSMESRAFRQIWFSLDIPWHNYHFNEKSMAYLMEKCRLRVIESSSLCLEQGLYGLLQSTLNAMGWSRNEFYEALKGNRDHGRAICLVIQLFILVSLLIPGFFITIFSASKGRGTSLKLIVGKEEK